MGSSSSPTSSSSSSILNLPHDVLVTELLPRLPVKTLFVLRSVCKEFLGLIDGPVRRRYDGSSAGRRKRRNPFLLYYVDDPVKDPNLGLHVFDFLAPGSGCFSSRLFSSVQLPSSRSWSHFHPGYSICRGLACFVNILSSSGQWSVQITVVNPSTRERVCIPESPNSAIGYRVGFGFLSSANEYKIVLLTHGGGGMRKQRRSQHGGGIRCEIFTLTDGGDPGSSSWRPIANRPPNKYDLVDKKHLCIDGVIYWVMLDSRGVLAFHLETEQFSTISLPVDTAEFPVPTLMDWGGSLCMLQQCPFDTTTKIWILNSGRDDKKKNNRTSYSWIRQPYGIDMTSFLATVPRGPGITIDHSMSHFREEEEEDLLVLDKRVDNHAKKMAYKITSVSSYNNKGQKRLVKVYNREEGFFNIDDLIINRTPLVYFETLFALTPRPSYNSNKKNEGEMVNYVDLRKRKSTELSSYEYLNKKMKTIYIDPNKRKSTELSSHEYNLNKKMKPTFIDPCNSNVGALNAISITLNNFSIH